MEHYTIMLIGAETSPVRRYEFSSQALLTWRRLGVALAVAFVIGVGDYVRLRIDQVELDELRVEVTHQRQKIQNFEITLADVEQRLSRIREFERKVRIIANLPGAKSEGGESEFGAFRVRGVEQQGEVFKPTHLPVRVGYVARPTGSAAADGTSVPSDLQRLAGDDALLLPEPQVTVELREEVERLGQLAAAREDSLMEVVSRLQVEVEDGRC